MRAPLLGLTKSIFFFCLPLRASVKPLVVLHIASLHVLHSLNWPENSTFHYLHLALLRIVRLRVDHLLEHPGSSKGKTQFTQKSRGYSTSTEHRRIKLIICLICNTGTSSSGLLRWFTESQLVSTSPKTYVMLCPT